MHRVKSSLSAQQLHLCEALDSFDRSPVEWCQASGAFHLCLLICVLDFFWAFVFFRRDSEVQAAARRLKQVSGYAPLASQYDWRVPFVAARIPRPPPTLSAASRLRAWASPRTANEDALGLSSCKKCGGRHACPCPWVHQAGG